MSSYLTYSTFIVKDVEVLSGFSIGGQNCNNLRYADNTALIADTESKLQELFQDVVKESENKGLTVNYTKTECMVVSKKNNSRCELRTAGTTIQKVQEFK